MRNSLLIIFWLLYSCLLAQTATQTVRGRITDRETTAPLIGVAVAVYNGDKLIGGAASDDNGYFRIERVPVGRMTITASYLGYKKILMPNTPVTSAKEVILNLDMEPSVTEMKEVTVGTGKKRGESINDMATISARAFTVEEASRYAGSRNDPARMASNFAGVSGTDDSRNDIVIRGNSPFGVQWRLENVNIPNPTHFAVAGTTGGPVGILNNRMLANSDFLTGAFPAEYGNALAGVFDVRYRNGNDQHHEFALQFGVLGAEVFAEGPISKKNKSSYMFNYRYATLDLLVAAGIDIGTKAVPKYQDAQFKLNFPLKKGNISVFGLGGYATVNLITSTDQKPGGREIYSSKDQDEFFRTGLGIIGLSYTRPLNEKAYAKITFAASTQWIQDRFIRVLRHTNAEGNYVLDGKYYKTYFRNIESKFSANWFHNYKLNGQQVLRFGMNTELNVFNYLDSTLNENNFSWQKRYDYRGAHFMFQPYVQWKFTINEKWSMVAGLHGQWFTLNNSWSIEPRASIKYQFRKNQSFGLGTGLHSQTQPMYIYFVKDNYTDPYNHVLRNKNLGFTRSYHLVASYDVFFKHDVRVKAEAYFQYLFDLPVEQRSSSYSILNEGSSFDRFFPAKLVNKGVGRNIGIELTVEKFFTHNWFCMFTGSLYDARYRASNGIWYNSDFNGNYIMNALGTKEFKWGKKRVNTIGLGGKITFGGGQRYTPYDTVLSKLSEDPVKQDAMRNKLQFHPYFRFDVRISYSCNTRKHITHEVGIDLVNITFQKNILRLQYIDAQTPPKEVYQLGFLPLFYYRIDFSVGKNKS
ncbi:MAG: carboxypeptidase-like regulatory domain-containing protein [Chitinophagales bacterium]